MPARHPQARNNGFHKRAAANDSRVMKTTPPERVSARTNEEGQTASFACSGVPGRPAKKISIFAERSFSELGK